MSKFCMYCGRELEKDEICNCNEKASARSTFASSSTLDEQESPIIDENSDNANESPIAEDAYTADAVASSTVDQSSYTQASYGKRFAQMKGLPMFITHQFQKTVPFHYGFLAFGSI